MRGDRRVKQKKSSRKFEGNISGNKSKPWSRHAKQERDGAIASIKQARQRKSGNQGEKTKENQQRNNRKQYARKDRNSCVYKSVCLSHNRAAGLSSLSVCQTNMAVSFLCSLRLSHNMANNLLGSVHLSQNGDCGLTVCHTIWRLVCCCLPVCHTWRLAYFNLSVGHTTWQLWSVVCHIWRLCAVVCPSVTQYGGWSLWSVGRSCNMAIAFLVSVCLSYDMLLSDMLGIVVKYLEVRFNILLSANPH